MEKLVLKKDFVAILEEEFDNDKMKKDWDRDIPEKFYIYGDEDITELIEENIQCDCRHCSRKCGTGNTTIEFFAHDVDGKEIIISAILMEHPEYRTMVDSYRDFLNDRPYNWDNKKRISIFKDVPTKFAKICEQAKNSNLMEYDVLHTAVREELLEAGLEEAITFSMEVIDRDLVVKFF